MSRVRRHLTSIYCLFPLLIALWDTRRRNCTSNPPCRLRDETTLPFSHERERAANANRVAQVSARLAPSLPARPLPVDVIGGVSQTPLHEQPRRGPSQSAFQYSGCNHDWDFGWINNPSACAQFTMTYTFPIKYKSNRCCKLHPSIHS